MTLPWALTLVVDLAFAINSHVAVAALQRAPDTYAESFLLAAEAKMIGSELAEALLLSAGMRNALVHNYLDVDYPSRRLPTARSPCDD